MRRLQGVKNLIGSLCAVVILLNVSCKSNVKESYGKKIAENMQQHNSDAIFSMFAPVFHEESSFKTDLYEFLETLYEMDLDFEKATRSDGAAAKDYENGKLIYYDDSVVYRDLFDASGNKYLLNVYYTQTDTKHPENVGLQSMDLVLKEGDGSSKPMGFIGRDINDQIPDSNYNYEPISLDD